MSKLFLAVVVTVAVIAGALSLSARRPQGPASTEFPAQGAVVEGITATDVSAATDRMSPPNAEPAESPGVSSADGDTGALVDDGRIEELENRIRQYIAQVPDLRLTSVGSVQCDETQCEIVFTGTDPNPQY